jgi:SAM-dependent methyltransferase
MPECRVCANAEGNRTFMAREMMFGLGDSFEYFECAACGCVQIGAVPPDLARFYPEGYYSYHTVGGQPEGNGLHGYVRRQLFRLKASRSPGVRSLSTRLFGPNIVADWVIPASVRTNQAVLDVGCGAGRELLLMAQYGFTDLTGVDKYIPSSFTYPNGVRVRKCDLADVAEQYDFVTLHHCFEHMPNPREALGHVHRVLRPNRYALVRIPLAGSHAWRTYGADWVQLDAPRHLYLHTVKSLNILAEQAGFRVTQVVYDSTEFQLWGSEQYRRGITLSDERSHWGGNRGEVFSAVEMAAFRAQAEDLNRRGDGDQACFYLLKSGA